MTDMNLTDEEWGFVSACLNTIASGHPDGPTEWEAEQYQSLLDMGFTETWIAENI
jgi:hypothetical protein